MTRWLDVLDRGFFDLVFPRDCAVTQEPMDDDARLHLSAADVETQPGRLLRGGAGVNRSPLARPSGVRGSSGSAPRCG